MSQSQTTARETTDAPEQTSILTLEKVETQEMMLEELQQIEYEIQVGIRDTMPDGTPVEKVFENLKEKQKNQAELLKESAPAKEEAEPAKVEVTFFSNGAISATQIGEKVAVAEPSTGDEGDDGEPKEPENDLPEAFPHRDKLIAAGFVSLETIAKFTIDDLKGIDGIGQKSAEAILNYGKSA